MEAIEARPLSKQLLDVIRWAAENGNPDAADWIACNLVAQLLERRIEEDE